MSLKGFWDRKEFAWVLKLEEHAQTIREEVMALRASVQGF
jgi:hypothetical protein